MKFLHTSDWHLGRSLYGRKRYDEFSAFLEWLGDTIETESIDALLIAGDVFDTSTPSNRAQELYYRFLCRVSNSCCRHIVIIAGNHDSPSFLNAPKELLRALNVYVVGAKMEDPGDEVFVISDSGSEGIDLDKTAIVCAVPYLRDKDIRSVEPGESIEDKSKKLVEGIKKHYASVVSIAENKRNELLKETESENTDSKIPIIAMGHLFAAEGRKVDGDGVRELYVGSLAHVGADVFPEAIDYLALGHLHVPQCVGNVEHMRYSGSPLPIGYGEAKREKTVVIVDSKNQELKIKDIPVPCFQRLERIAGSLDEIRLKIEQLKKEESRAWLEIEYTGKDIAGNLRETLDEAMEGSDMEIRLIKNKRVIDRVISTIKEEETLDDMDVNDIFKRCLEAHDISEEDRKELTASHKEIIKSLQEEDVNAE